jgi:hypothetical protein
MTASTTARSPRRRIDVVAVLAVGALGVCAGAMLAEATLLVPYWRDLPPDDFLRWFAANEPRLTAFYGPLEVAAAVLAIAAAGMAAVRRRSTTRPLAIAALLAVGVLLMYPLYFQEANASFVARTIASAAVPAELARWAAWQWVRVALGAAAFVAATLAVAARGA